MISLPVNNNNVSSMFFLFFLTVSYLFVNDNILSSAFVIPSTCNYHDSIKSCNGCVAMRSRTRIPSLLSSSSSSSDVSSDIKEDEEEEEKSISAAAKGDESDVVITIETTTTIDTNGKSKPETDEKEEESEVVPVKKKEETFQEKTKRLCHERNIKFANIKNARDLASVRNSPIVPGKIYRTGRVSDASEADIECMKEELKLKTLIDLRSPTELKDDPTLMRPQVFQDFTSVVWREGRPRVLRNGANEKGERKGSKVDGHVRELAQDESPIRKKQALFNNNANNNVNGEEVDDYYAAAAAVAAYTACVDSAIVDDSGVENIDEIAQMCKLQYEVDQEYADVIEADEEEEELLLAHKYTRVTDLEYNGDRKERLFVSLMNELKYVRGTLSKIRKRDLAKTLLKTPGTIFSRRVRNSFKKPFLDKINGGGLPMLNELLLRYGSPGIKYVLEICADEQRHPIAFYCTAGKDRTGMIAAILLSLCGAAKEDIIEDYSLSDTVYAEMNDHQAMVGALSQRNLDPKTFLCAPPEVMKNTLDIIEQQYGSVEGYCNWIGFGPEKQQKIRDILMIDKGTNI